MVWSWSETGVSVSEEHFRIWLLLHHADLRGVILQHMKGKNRKKEQGQSEGTTTVAKKNADESTSHQPQERISTQERGSRYQTYYEVVTISLQIIHCIPTVWYCQLLLVVVP